ncbi:uncharacterized protein N7483_008954 [Penicillium malachiteum]|uniref:uncharacterized protein n=1 Tax=Penicillium malachiteum TaxID=1324776 RepID=UPI002548A128|nr:uncharacterized protein N7483_008954 [Penicillium malachiteum]KAJ5721020.1 hypothetical protein N7483_008954 [Penicillium malachiteum]
MSDHVVPIPDEILQQAGIISIFPAAVHRDHELAVEDARQLRHEFSSEINMDLDTKTIANIPGFGHSHVTALTMPECLPERLSLITLFTESTFLNDDYYDKAGAEKVDIYNQRLKKALRTENHEGKPDHTSGLYKGKQLQAGFLIKMLQIDHELASDVMSTYSRILDAASVLGKSGLLTLREYCNFRLFNSGMETYQDMCCFGIGLKIDRKAKEKLALIVNVAHTSTFLINDYYSWPKEVREYFEVDENPNLPVNAVCIMMQYHGCSEQEALQGVRDEIITQQKLHLSMIKELEESEGPLPETWRVYIEAAQYPATGSEIWSIYSPRYPTKSELNQPECIIVGNTLEYKTINDIPHGLVESDTEVETRCDIMGDMKFHPISSSPAHIFAANGEKTAEFNSFPIITHAVENNEELTNGDKETCIESPEKSQNSSNITVSTNGDYYSHEEGLCGREQNSSDTFLQKATEVSLLYPKGSFEKKLNSEQTVTSPSKYISSLPSKNIRDKFLDALNVWFGIPEEPLLKIKRIVGLLHHSSLMLDDIEDDSMLRRGMPCAHSLYGPAQTINSANYAFVTAFAETLSLRNSSATDIFINEVQNMHRGQAMDLHWKYHTQCPTEEEYMQMIDNKTGAMFRLCVRLMQAESSLACQHINPDPLVLQLGRYFQVRDDYQNLLSDEYSSQKGFCEDLDEGKISLPIIYTIMNPSFNGSVIKGIFQHKAPGEMCLPMKKYILEEMKQTGALDMTLSLIRDMQKDLLDKLSDVEDAFGSKNPLVELVLRRLWI